MFQVILKMSSQKGFPKEPDQYQLFLKNRGSEKRRQLSTIKPSYLRIPFAFRFVAYGSMEDVVAAVRFALEQARARAPVRSGAYKGSIGIWSNNGSNIRSPPEKIPIDTIFGIGPNVDPYDAIIEWGFFSGYYKTGSRPDGIFYHAAKLTDKKFGDNISIRFLYINGSPSIEIAAAGQFPDTFRRPGSDRSRAKGRRSRGIKTRRSSNRRF